MSGHCIRLSKKRKGLFTPLALALGGLVVFSSCATSPYKKHTERGFQYLEWGHGHIPDYEAAEREFREAVRLKPESPQAHYNLGKAYEDHGMNPGPLSRRQLFYKAITEYRKVLQLKPDFVDAWVSIGFLFESIERPPEEAEKEYREAVHWKPDDFNALTHLAGILDVRGLRKEAREYWEKALKACPKKEDEFKKYIQNRLLEWD